MSTSQFVYPLSHWWAFELFAIFGYFQNKIFLNILVHVFLWTCLGVIWLGRRKGTFICKRNCYIFFNWSINIILIWSISCSISLLVFGIDCHFNFNHSRKHSITSLASISISLVASDVEHLYLCAYCPFVYLLFLCLLKYFSHFKKLGYLYSYYWVVIVYFTYTCFIRYVHYEYFFSQPWLAFSFS